MSALQPPDKFLSFDDWLTENEELVERHFEDAEYDCEACNGTGSIVVTDRKDYRFQQRLRRLYDQQRTADAKKLADWNRIIHEET